ncbi:MAG: hypothetical protein KDI98_10600, partial [Hyphomicrobiaceae bacterium]|nr:hypothetical protein [Hyphomicrobiaceae bacterium]
MLRPLVLAVLFALALPAVASAQLLTSEDPEYIAQVLREQGQVARVTTDSVGDPMIETSVNGIDYR